MSLARASSSASKTICSCLLDWVTRCAEVPIIVAVAAMGRSRFSRNMEFANQGVAANLISAGKKGTLLFMLWLEEGGSCGNNPSIFFKVFNWVNNRSSNNLPISYMFLQKGMCVKLFDLSFCSFVNVSYKGCACAMTDDMLIGMTVCMYVVEAAM